MSTEVDKSTCLRYTRILPEEMVFVDQTTGECSEKGMQERRTGIEPDFEGVYVILHELRDGDVKDPHTEGESNIMFIDRTNAIKVGGRIRPSSQYVFICQWCFGWQGK